MGMPLRSILVPGPVPEAAFLGGVVAALLGPLCFFAVLGGRASARELVVALVVVASGSTVRALLVGFSTAVITPVVLLATSAARRVVRGDRVT
jgi:hypothetical protein